MPTLFRRSDNSELVPDGGDSVSRAKPSTDDTVSPLKSSAANAIDDIDVDFTAIQAFTDEDGAPATLPEMGNVGEEGKFKVIVGLLKKYVALGPMICGLTWLMPQARWSQRCCQPVGTEGVDLSSILTSLNPQAPLFARVPP